MQTVDGSIVAKSVKNRHNAYVAPNNVQEFTKTIINAFTEKDNYELICENAFNELYITWEKTGEKILERYKSLIQKFTFGREENFI